MSKKFHLWKRWDLVRYQTLNIALYSCLE